MEEQQNNVAGTSMNKKKSKNTKWIIIGVVAIIIIIAVATSPDKGDKQDKAASNTVETIEQKDNSSNTKETVKSEDKSEGTSSDTFKKGEIYKGDSIKISYYDCGTFTNYKSYAKPDQGKKIIYAEFEFENISKDDETMNTFDCYADGNKCQEYYWSGEDILTFDSISSGNKVKGKVFFQVPKKAKSIKLEYKINLFDSEKVIFVVK